VGAVPNTHVLANSRLSVLIDRAGAIIAVTNKLTHETYRLTSTEFTILSRDGEWTNRDLTAEKTKIASKSLDFTMEGHGMTAVLHYRMGDQCLEKWVGVRFDKAADLLRLQLGDRRISPNLGDILCAYGNRRDNPDYPQPANTPTPQHPNTVPSDEIPIYVALRSAKGGLFTGVTCPLFEPKTDRLDRVELSYPVNVHYAAGQTHESEKEFIGAYRDTGSFCRKQLEFVQSARAKIWPSSELTDWGEVWAVQDYIDSKLPTITSNLLGDRMSLNGRWYMDYNVLTTDPAAIPIFADAAKRSHDAHLDLFWIYCPWLGMGGYGGYDTNPVMDLSRRFDFHVKGSAATILDAITKNGLLVDSFCGGETYRSAGIDDFRVKPASGKLGVPCQGSDAYIDWLIGITEKCFTEAKAHGATVGNWWWDMNGINLDELSGIDCGATNHSHLPGDARYAWWKGTQKLFRVLRERHPETALAMCWSIKRGGPWILKDVSTEENLAENWRGLVADDRARMVLSAADELRLQHWYCQNYRFMPPSKNLAQLFFDRREDPDWRYSLMSCLASGVRRIFAMDLPVYGKTMAPTVWADPGGPGLYSPGNRLIWMSMNEIAPDLAKWKKWATSNLKALGVKRDLFGQPCREEGIDGSAHMIGDHGFVFLFNPWSHYHAGSIPFDSRILLTAGKRYRVDMLYPNSGRSCGSFRHGDSLVVELPPRAAYLLEIKPYAGPDLPHGRIDAGVDIQPAFPKPAVMDTFSRPYLGRTEDDSHHAWIVGEGSAKVVANALSLGPDLHGIGRAGVEGFKATDLDATFLVGGGFHVSGFAYRQSGPVPEWAGGYVAEVGASGVALMLRGVSVAQWIRPVDLSKPHLMRVTATGDRQRVWLDGAQVIDANDHRNPSAGYVGFLTAGPARFDDLVVTRAAPIPIDSGIQGIVTDASHRPVAGALVVSADGLRTTTGPDGRYRFPQLEAGQYNLTAYDATVVPETKTILAEPGRQSHLDFVFALPESGPTVTDNFARPDGAEIGATEDASHIAWTKGKDASATIADHYLAIASAPWTGVSLADQMPADVDVTVKLRYTPGTENGAGIAYRQGVPGTINGGGYLVYFDDAGGSVKFWRNNVYIGEKVIASLDWSKVERKDVYPDWHAAPAEIRGIDWSRSHMLRILAIGDRHRVWLDGVPVWDLIDDERLTGGFVGLMGKGKPNARFSDFSVWTRRAGK